MASWPMFSSSYGSKLAQLTVILSQSLLIGYTPMYFEVELLLGYMHSCAWMIVSEDSSGASFR